MAAPLAERILSRVPEAAALYHRLVLVVVADPKGKQALRAFLDGRELPDPVPGAFVKALQEVLRGLQKVVVTPEALREALLRRRPVHPAGARGALRALRRRADQGQGRQEGPRGGGVTR